MSSAVKIAMYPVQAHLAFKGTGDDTDWFKSCYNETTPLNN